jgi:adenylate cyclase
MGLIAGLLLGTIALLIWNSASLFIDDAERLIQLLNSQTASGLSRQTQELVNSITERMRVVGTVLIPTGAETAETTASQAPLKERLLRLPFESDSDFLGVALHKHPRITPEDQNSKPVLIAKKMSPELASLGDPDGDKMLSDLEQDHGFSFAKLLTNDAQPEQIGTVKLSDGSVAIAIAIPFVKLQEDAQAGSKLVPTTLVGFVKSSRFLKIFTDSSGSTTNWMVDGKGKLLAHPDTARVSAGEYLTQLELVRKFTESLKMGEKRYEGMQDGQKVELLGSIQPVGFGKLGVVSETPYDKATSGARRVVRRSIFFAIIFLCFAFAMGYVFAGSLTFPIKLLMDAARRIQEGDYAIDVKSRGNDELAHLSVAFNNMAKGLEEGMRLKAAFRKYHNKKVAEKLMSGEVKLGGERKNATVFFSDVRGFTSLAESMEPEQVVELLNEYMTRMLTIIEKYDGIVDKFVGDAIMGVWGVPDADAEAPYKALRACLEMRAELDRLNEVRLARGQSVIKIGMGLNTGPLISGNIGSNERLEYTVIGDAVNLASRIESLTKEYGTDLLISKNVEVLVKDRFVLEPCKSSMVKGKSQAIDIFKVKGYIDENGNPVIIETPYSNYPPEKSEKVVRSVEGEISQLIEKPAVAPVAPAAKVALPSPETPAAAEKPAALEVPLVLEPRPTPEKTSVETLSAKTNEFSFFDVEPSGLINIKSLSLPVDEEPALSVTDASPPLAPPPFKKKAA